MSIFSFSLVICALLQRPRIAGTLATLLHFLTYFATVPVADASISITIKTIFSFVPNIAMALCIEAISTLESNGVGVTFSTLNQKVNNYKVGIAFTTWTIMFFVLLLLALYLDNVLPKEFGKQQPLFYFLTKRYWLGDNEPRRAGEQQRLLDGQDDDAELNGEKQDFEAVPKGIREQEKNGDCLKVRGLRKIYGNGKEAVKNLSLTMYKDQIFALLGHNGAGKTTTLSILTGLYPATAGKASVFNLDMFGQIEEVRKILGVCPQFDILFDLLTPIEHLQLYCMFKGVPAERVQEEVTKTLKDVDLESKKDAYSKNLSGGQKRKLSVGIAMIGGSKLVLLDEPTSGMDLTARRKIWDMLKNNKDDRILILTTHFMDEADILGDRIAIMAGGQIKCCGGSLFLKRRFGVGYNLVIAKESKEPNPEIDRFVMDRIPEAIKLSEVSSEVTFQIPQTESSKFEDFFTELDQSLRDLRIKSYGVGVTTLEEVFLRVGRDEEESETQSRKSINNLKKDIEEEKFQKNGTKKSLNASGDVDGEEYSIAERSEQGTLNIFWLHFVALSIKRFLVSFRQLKTSILELLIPIILIILGLAFANIQFFKDPVSVALSLGLYPAPQNLYYTNYNKDASTPEALNDYMNLFGDREKWNVPKALNVGGTNIKEFLEAFEKEAFENNSAYDSEVKNVGNHLSYQLNRDTNTYQVIGFGNSYGREGAPLQMQLMLNAALRAATGNNNISFNTKSVPFPLTATATAGAKAGSGSIVAFLFAIAFAMIPAGVASQIVSERESNVKHQQYISGASMVSYWISNYVVDLIRSLIPISVAIICVFAFNVDLPEAWILFLLFAISIHPFTYATSFWFKKENMAQSMTILLHIFLGGFIAIAILVLRAFDDTRDVAKILRWFPKIIPSYCVISGILQISSRQIFARATGMANPDPPLSWNIAGGDALFLGINFFFWWSILILYESKLLNFSCRRRGGVNDVTRRTEQVRVDEDVRNEEVRCEDLSPSECSVLVKRLRKVYTEGTKSFIAVRNISFGLEYGECFALLGVNGAGKTTTFKSMTGDVKPSDGNIYIDGLDLSSREQFSRARKLIGYCPQENAIFEGMTVSEHLWFYARIKGVLAEKRRYLIEKIMEEMDLKEFENIRCESLSGGNKRKLSVAMAMIGNPPIVFLDEPSTGMDPRAKRFMWTIISRISTLRKKSTVILTTHSMEEAEALCTKMGIMVNGRFKCYGSAQDIKDKFGTGYEVEIKISWPTEKEARELAEKYNVDLQTEVTSQNLESLLRRIQMERLLQVQQYTQILADVEKEKSMSIIDLFEWALLEDAGLFVKKALERNTSDCRVLEHYNNFFRFRIERGEKSLGFFFGFMENLKSEVKFEEYAVSQTTLEQIFNAFALEQDSNESVSERRSTVRKDKEL